MQKLILFILIFGFACVSKEDPPPNLIPKEQMIMLLTEIHLLESKIKNLRIHPEDSTKAVYTHYEELLFGDFNITKSQYRESFKYYVNNIEEFTEVYDAIVDTLMQREKIESY